MERDARALRSVTSFLGKPALAVEGERKIRCNRTRNSAGNASKRGGESGR